MSKFLRRFEDGVLISAFASMLVLATLQILLRNFFDAGLLWAESFLRVLVLWIAMLGAMVATREGSHININAVSRYLTDNIARIVSAMTCLVSSLICCTIAWYALELVKFEYQDRTIAFASVPNWVCQSILPIGFIVMSLRFLIVLLALLGAPLFVVILAAGMTGFYFSEIPLTVIPIEIYRLVDTPLLLALPLFTFSGYLLAESNLSTRLVRLTRVFLGWMPGGLAVVSFVTCAFFTAFTGASGVTIVALGALLLPALVEAGYRRKFSLGLVTTSGSLGLLLAPSLPLILYGVIVQQMDLPDPFTIQELFIAGVLPAILMIVLLTVYSIWTNRGEDIARGDWDRDEAIDALLEAKWEIPLPFIVLGGIYTGFFAVSEAAAVTAVYVLVVEVLVYREVALGKLPSVIRDAMVMVGGILLILGVSLAFTNYLIDAEVPQWLFEWIRSFVTSKVTFLILLNIVLLVLGAILDIFSALVIMVPLIVPVALGFGVDPIHLGIIFLANMQIGYFTPPIGMNLFIASYRFRRSITELYNATIPFMLVLLLALMLITYVPALSLAFLDR